MFTRSEVIMLTNEQTNKQTPLKTSNALRYATVNDAVRLWVEHVCSHCQDDTDIRRLRQIRRLLGRNVSRLDYCNAVLAVLHCSAC